MKSLAIAALLGFINAAGEDCTTATDCPFEKGVQLYCGKRESCTTAEKDEAKATCKTAAEFTAAVGMDAAQREAAKHEGCVWNYGMPGYG